MRTFFHPYLPNGPTGDPLMWVDLIDEGEALLVDLGDLHAVPPRKLLRVRRVVVTHTHMDHFVGFDPFLRLLLRRDRDVTLAGPPGFIGNVEARLQGYSWNLIEDYPVRLRVEEVRDDRVHSAVFAAAGRFRRQPCDERPFDGTLAETETYRVEVAVLDHGIPVLGVALRETERLAVDKDRLVRLGLSPGPWLGRLKTAVRRGEDLDATFELPATSRAPDRLLPSAVAAEILSREVGQSIAYLTDFGCTQANVETAVSLVRGVHLLVCEAAFLHEDSAMARDRKHLTARQAGELAREAGAETLSVFHVSPRYEGREQELLDEAARSFGGPVVRLPGVL